jgi:hypothetical protein
MDYVDFVVHVFRTDKREFYRLERLWGDAPVIDPATLIESPARRRKPATRSARS